MRGRREVRGEGEEREGEGERRIGSRDEEKREI